MKTFKIRDLMIALRPGIGTPERPKPFDCCLPSECDDGVTIEPFDDTGGCDCTEGDTCDCSDECTEDCTAGCSDACTGGCTDACTAGCTDACTGACTAGCTEACTAACTAACTNACTQACTECTGCTDCTKVTCGYCSGECTNCTATCKGGCSECGITLCGSGCTMTVRCGVRPSVEPPLPVEKMDSADLARLKKQLRSTVSQVRQRDKALAAETENKTAAPKSVEEVDALAKLLSEALEELRSKRAELEKSGQTETNKPKKGGKS